MISDSGESKPIHPFVEIIEHPASKAIRFRYECEGRSAGSIPGENNTPDNKTFPTIRINGYKGRGVVVVSCVTKDPPYRPHPHSLVGKGMCESGICKMPFKSPDPTGSTDPNFITVTFTNLGIQCVKKKDIYSALQKREEMGVDPFRTGFDHKTRAIGIDLNAVRLCFLVFIETPDGKRKIALQPVVSKPIYDKKAMSDLQICKLSHDSATVDGGMKMVLLCEKVAKDNIQVRFFEKRDGREVWEGFGDFSSIYVHKQVAIAFHTPKYRDLEIVEPVQVFIELRRPTDGVTSEACPFEFLPSGTGEPDFLKRKRRRLNEIPRTLLQLQAQSEMEAALLEDPLEQGFNPMRLEARVQSFPIDPTVTSSANLIPQCSVGAAWGQSSVKNIVETPAASNQQPIFPIDAAWGRSAALKQSNILIDVPAYENRPPPPGTLPLASRVFESYNIPMMANCANVADQFENSRDDQFTCRMQRQNEVSKIHQAASPHFGFYQGQQNEMQPNMGLQKITPPPLSSFNRNENAEGFEGAAGGAGLMEITGQPYNSDVNLSQIDSADLAHFDDVGLSESLSGLLMNDTCGKVEINGTLAAMTVGVGSSVS